MTVDAGTRADWKLLRISFKAWRDEAVVVRLETQIDQRILEQSFSYWMVRQRGRLLERVRDQRFTQETFEIWRDRYEEIHERLNFARHTFEENRNLRTLKSLMYIWQQIRSFHQQEYEVAMVLCFNMLF